MWIRSEDGLRLMDCIEFAVNSATGIISGCSERGQHISLGHYHNDVNATRVLREIQDHLALTINKSMAQFVSPVFQMPKCTLREGGESWE